MPETARSEAIEAAVAAMHGRPRSEWAAAFAAALRATGYVVLPVEPTDLMARTWERVHASYQDPSDPGALFDAYRAMLAAAAKEPQG